MEQILYLRSSSPLASLGIINKLAIDEGIHDIEDNADTVTNPQNGPVAADHIVNKQVQVNNIELGQFPYTDEYLRKFSDAELSILVSKVLTEIGITEELVEARRNTWLEIESMTTVHWRVQDENLTWYHFGSQTEGTTTFGLDSDVDMLVSQNDNRIILDIHEWKQGFDNLLVHKQENTSPGYCKLLPMSSEEPILMTDVDDDEMHELGKDGQVYLKCEFLQDRVDTTEEIHGPAWNRFNSKRGIDEDFVNAYYCSHLPKEAMAWIDRTKDKPWPKDPVRKRVIESGCFIAAVGHKQSTDLRTEFRMSTTLGERILMFDMNISQIQCLVLMKMLMKTIVSKHYKDAIKSFYCKTALFFVTEQCGKDMFREDSILECLRKCLQWIYKCLKNGYNPHYMINSLDMFEGRLDATLREKVGEVIKDIIDNPGLAILNVQFDELGKKLYNRIKDSENYISEPKELIRSKIGNFLSRTYVLWGLWDVYLHDDPWNFDRVHEIKLNKEKLSRCEILYKQGDIFMQTATKRYRYLVQANLGMLMAAESIKNDRKLSDFVLQALKEGTFADAVSGRLKYATVLVSLNDITGACGILKEVEKAYSDLALESMCTCTGDVEYVPKTGFGDEAWVLINTGSLHAHICKCLLFVETLKPSFPCGWLDAVFRPIDQRSDMDDQMEYVSLDPKPYYHFVEMMLHKELNNQSKALTALQKLEKCVSEEQLFHKDTAMVLLSHALEMNEQLEQAKIIYDDACFIRKRNIGYRSSHVRFNVLKQL
ncbi:uncharacterized protein LOC127882424 [Dreissena polymorpha]|uniref:Mab-21-like HhH/H2TH-like domain-containing protein n=1 Tax=Dreissena polymorpha TaxID=45954 RepID=A0A9D4H4U1_DREPO|nr:uncharacterized protein LOC127882424 [Dreissena polymorpha]XP_052287017.1 uncharacterized protein LOC127882424 [Dreissena polymorpha]KAH3827458.1 hypothetical protein DPMN_129395 [Dreissena polymorpha]